MTTNTKRILAVLLALVLVAGGIYLYTSHTAPSATAEEPPATTVDTDPATDLEADPEAETERDFSWIEESFQQFETEEEPAEEIPEEFQPSVTETVNEDGSVTIDRTWGVKPEGAISVEDPTVANANLGSGGGEVPLDEDGVYRGDNYQETPVVEEPILEEPVAEEPAPSTSTEPEPEEVATPAVTEPEPTVEEPVASTPSQSSSSSSSSSSPQNGDIKYDDDGQKWVYNSIFGWTKSSGTGGLIEVLPGGGDPIPNASWG